MSLLSRMQNRCQAYASDLAMFVVASRSTAASQASFTALREHLRGLYKLRSDVFDSELVARISSCTSVGATPLHIDSRILVGDGKFVEGHFYLAGHGTYQVLSLNPFPTISPAVYPKCASQYFMSHMWKEHLRLIQATHDRQRSIDSFVQTYSRPRITPGDELDAIKLTYDLEIAAAHRAFFESIDITYPGTRVSKRAHRTTRCYKCRDHLDSAIDTECNSCRWIVCGCGACGCGFGGVGYPRRVVGINVFKRWTRYCNPPAIPVA